MEGLLLAIGFLGIVCALLTRWTKTGTLVTLVSFYFYFDVVGIENWVPLILFTLGLLLIVLEILIPGFGFVGLLGTALVIGGLYYTIGDIFQTIRDLSMSVVISTAVIIYLVRRGYSLTGINKLVLNTNLQTQNEEKAEDNKIVLQPGLVGVAQTPLRPSGKATFGGADSPIYDVLSTEGLISISSPIVIEKIQGTKILVRSYKQKGDE
ncbi:MAG TPA: hydrolase [Enterococcus sp.]|nr:hydrolase [Enterococcus sp.]HPR81104.1 hydrolase [Enterococcus sp.]